MLLRLFQNLLTARADPIPEKATALNLEHQVRTAYQVLQSGKSDQAEVLLKVLLSDNPDHIDSLCLLAELYLGEERDTEAIELYHKALKLDRTIDVVYLNLARLYLRQRSRKQAAVCLTQGKQVLGRNREVANTTGLLWLELGRHTEAEACFRRALELEPEFPPVLCNLGLLSQQRGDPERALDFFRRALKRQPDMVEALHNSALIHREMGRPLESLALLERAIQIKPDFALAHANLGVVQQALGHTDVALRSLDRALKLDPESADIHLSKAHLLLSLGRYREGWQEYEWRLLIDDYPWHSPRETFPFPELNDLSAPGGNVLVYAEQGLGDEIMLASCIPDLVESGRQVILECDPRLEALFRRSFPEVMVRGRRNQPPGAWLGELHLIDWQLASGSLPRFFRNSLADFPCQAGYLVADPVRVAKWRVRLAAMGTGLKVGISWRGGTGRTDQNLRSIPLCAWQNLLALPGVQFVNLQYTDSCAERAELSRQHGLSLHHWPAALENYDETAALVTALDLIVTVCNSLVHLAGSLGQAVWVLVPSQPGWRYGLEGASMPWYPTVRLLRQPREQGWQVILDDVMRLISREIPIRQSVTRE